MAVVSVFRKRFLEDRTLGEMYVNGNLFCYTLEDAVRGPGIKIAGRTAIPAGVYQVVVNHSPAFGREMTQLLNVPGFDGIRCHGGNGPENTSGCLLIAFKLAAGDKIYSTAEASFTAMVKNLIECGDRVFISIVDDVNGVTGVLGS